MANPWFSSLPSGNQMTGMGIYGASPSPIKAPVTAAAQTMDVVDYVKKKRIADALRKRAEGGAYDTADSLITTGGYNGGPEMVQVNYGGILQNALKPYFDSRLEEKAATADSEAAAMRREALARLTGKETGQQLLTMGEELQMPELTKSALEQLLPEQMNAAAYAQASATPEGVDALVRLRKMTPEEGEIAKKGIADRAAEALRLSREQYIFEQDNKRFAPTSGGGSGTTSGGSNLTPGLLQLYGKEISEAKDQYGALRATRRSLDAMDELIYGKKDKDGKRIPNSGALGLGSAALSHAASMGIPLAQYAQSSSARQLETIINEQILAKADQLSGALSDKDLAFLERSLMSLKDNPESAAAIYEGVKSRLEGVEGRLLTTRKGMIDMDERLGGFWIDPTTGEEVQEPTIGITAPKEATPIGTSWTDGGDGYEYRIVDGKKYRRKNGG